MYIMAIIVLGAFLIYTLIDPIALGLGIPCPFHAVTGLHCPGCGSQRAIHCAVRGDLSGVSANNVLLWPAVAIVIYHNGVQLYNRNASTPITNYLYKKRTAIIIVTIVILFWILRNIPSAPFNWLAPVAV